MENKMHPYTFAGLLTSAKKQTSNNIDKLFLVITELYGVTKEELTSSTRLGNIVDLRRIAMYYLNVKLGMTSIMTGRILNRDHATVLHNVNKIDDLYKYDPRFRNVFDSIMNQLNDKINDENGRVVGDVNLKRLI